MSTITIAPAPATTETLAPAEPLTAEQQDALLLLAVSTEKPNTIRAPKRWDRRGVGESRAWSRGGNVD